MYDSYTNQRFFASHSINKHTEKDKRRKQQFYLIKLGILVTFIFLISGVLVFFLFFVNHPPRTSGPQSNSYSLTFLSSISYIQALDIVTNLGLQPGILCSTNSRLSTRHQQEQTLLWQPMGQRETFSDTHRLVVVLSEYTPSDLLQRLHLSGKVLNIEQIGSVSPPCPSSRVGIGPYTPNTLTPLQGDQGTISTRITFNTSVTYSIALYQVSDLGFLLADPCYKKEMNAQTRIHFPWNSEPSWHPMSQKSLFNKTHTLLVETIPLLTPSHWQSQLETTNDVTSSKIQSDPSC